MIDNRVRSGHMRIEAVVWLIKPMNVCLVNHVWLDCLSCDTNPQIVNHITLIAICEKMMSFLLNNASYFTKLHIAKKQTLHILCRTDNYIRVSHFEGNLPVKS